LGRLDNFADCLLVSMSAFAPAGQAKSWSGLAVAQPGGGFPLFAVYLNEGKQIEPPDARRLVYMCS